MAYLFIITLINMRFTKEGGKLMSRIKERVFLNVVIINSAKSARETHTTTHTKTRAHERSKVHTRTHSNAKLPEKGNPLTTGVAD